MSLTVFFLFTKHAPLEARMGQKKLSSKTTHTGGYPGDWGCQKCVQQKNLMGKLWLEPIFLIWWSGGCFLKWNLSSFTYEALYYNKTSINFHKICVVLKDFSLSLNLGLTASFSLKVCRNCDWKKAILDMVVVRFFHFWPLLPVAIDFDF